MAATKDFYFIGSGDAAELEPRKERIGPWGGTIGPWKRRRGEPGIPDDENKPPEHPSNYATSDSLADAVNTAISLGKPLLVTGNPGTGKSQLAERIAWELNLGPVLRFEAQSLSEANDLFYRFDLVGYLSAVELVKAGRIGEQAPLGSIGTGPSPHDMAYQFLTLGPLGEAIVRSDPVTHGRIFDAVFSPGDNAASAAPRPSVVLIDEIDKASRDFPNDLLNGIERREFGIRELGIQSVAANPDYAPIVVITSNSERDLPAPFLRRCTFFHIVDPEQPTLAAILIRKFFPTRRSSDGTLTKRAQLPKFYAQLLDHFVLYRNSNESLQYAPGTSELIDWTQALILRKAAEDADLASELDKVKRTASTVAKHRDDRKALVDFLDSLVTTPASS